MSGYRIQRFTGNSCEIGLQIGCHLKGRLRTVIDQFIKAVDQVHHLDLSKLNSEAPAWLSRLPEEFLLELESMAYSSGVKLDRIAQWIYCDRYIAGGCTSFICKVGEDTWVGRNNDYAGPNLWRNINVIEKEGYIPVVLFGLEGEIFSGTGYNTDMLWLHYNYLPVWDSPNPDEKAIPPFVFIRMALQKCKNLNDVEHLLQTVVRDGGMNLFAVDGRNNNFAVYECTCRGFVKRQSIGKYIAGSNHYIDTKLPKGLDIGDASSEMRLAKMEYLLQNKSITNPYHDLAGILADPGVEQNNGLSGTVYANLACPARNIFYYACNGFPAASKARFEEVILP